MNVRDAVNPSLEDMYLQLLHNRHNLHLRK